MPEGAARSSMREMRALARACGIALTSRPIASRFALSVAGPSSPLRGEERQERLHSGGGH